MIEVGFVGPRHHRDYRKQNSLLSRKQSKRIKSNLKYNQEFLDLFKNNKHNGIQTNKSSVKNIVNAIN